MQWQASWMQVSFMLLCTKVQAHSLFHLLQKRIYLKIGIYLNKYWMKQENGKTFHKISIFTIACFCTSCLWTLLLIIFHHCSYHFSQKLLQPNIYNIMDVLAVLDISFLIKITCVGVSFEVESSISFLVIYPSLFLKDQKKLI